jgi:dienelactone hydrolase/Tol biopolymer transport system component
MEEKSDFSNKLNYERFTQYFHYSSARPLSGGDIIYVSDISGQFNIWRQSMAGGLSPGYQRMLTAFSDWTVRGISLTRDERRIYFMADKNGDEHYQLFTIPSSGGEMNALTSDREITYMLNEGALDGAGSRLLYASNARTRTDFDIVVRDLKAGRESMPLETGYLWGDASWDHSGRRFKAVQQFSNTDVRSFFHDLKRKKTTEILPHKEEAIVYAAGWTADGRILLVTDLGSEFRKLLLYDPVSGSSSKIYAGRHDVEAVCSSASGNRVFYVINNGGYSEVYECRPGGKHSKLRLPKKGWVNFSGIEIDAKDRRLGMVWVRDAAPPEILLYDIKSGKNGFVTESMAGGVPAGIPSPELVHYKSFDGRDIPAFYYPPAGKSGKSPAVLSIHGGPEAQERPGWGYSGLYQFLQKSGIAVLCPNVRGSTGYGKTYQKLIHRDWGGNELRDFDSAARWLKSRKDIDAGRLGVFGGSFGGFATLSCVSRLPSYWKAGVDICGPSNLVTFCRSVPPFWQRFMKEWVGDAEKESDFLMERSPITYIEDVRADMLIVQGANDPRVVKAESDQMVQRLRDNGRSIEYMIFDDEGHGFTKTANARKGFGRCADFLAEKLKG